ncbi:MAG: ferredoxin family protein [Ignavibacteriae bacterium]|nr:ferredoxin family protein [Ignavibacteriota bacterium]
MSETTTKKPRKVKGKTVVDIQKCKGCEICITACRENGIKLSKEINNLGYRYAVIVDDLCTGCTNCALVCPDGVIKVYRTSPKKKELVAEIKNVQADMKIKIER